MFARRYITLLLWICGCLTLFACEKSCGKKSEALPEKNAQPNAHEGKRFGVTSFNNLNLNGLASTQVASLTRLFNEEICPCGCPKTFAQCINMTSGCKPAQLLAQLAANQLKEGAPEHFLFKAISEEIGAGYLAPIKTIDTKNAQHKGRVDAPITIVEFADFECPSCKIASVEIKKLLKDNNDVQIYFMHFPLSLHPNAERAAIAAEAAGKQGKFWEMHDLLFSHNGALTDAAIKDLAKTIFSKKQMIQFDKDLTDPKIVEKIHAQREYGQKNMNLLGTPSFFINGRPYHLFSSVEAYKTRFAMEKARDEIKCQAE
jgi:protein-disulfide isomerase